ncbi:MAG TPA: ANTAR domain-containing protein [Propionibacteriaceae bacterium]|nr:ANTAR domain-containing protein [Propionibacteriaceae bacterium]
MVSQPPPTEVGLVLESLEASSRAAQLEAEIAPLKNALARRQQIGVATGLLAQRFARHPERAWSLLVRLSQKRPCQGTQHRSGHHQRALQPTQPSRHRNSRVIEIHMPDGVRLIGARVDGQQPTSKSSQ